VPRYAGRNFTQACRSRLSACLVPRPIRRRDAAGWVRSALGSHVGDEGGMEARCFRQRLLRHPGLLAGHPDSTAPRQWRGHDCVDVGTPPGITPDPLPQDHGTAPGSVDSESTDLGVEPPWQIARTAESPGITIVIGTPARWWLPDRRGPHPINQSTIEADRLIRHLSTSQSTRLASPILAFG
jgi:hypothetical protein